jgi:hypothetical protein
VYASPSRRHLVAAAALAVLALASLASACGGDRAPAGESDRAIAAAMDAYENAKTKNLDLEVGPCIAERLPGLDDWVADIAHDPRQGVDEEPENQCRRFRDGEATHFVELTPDGELIRAE